jgi:hypothetical protein
LPILDKNVDRDSSRSNVQYPSESRTINLQALVEIIGTGRITLHQFSRWPFRQDPASG